MAIRLETSQRTGIDNYQDSQISAFQLNWSRDIRKIHPRAIPRTAPNPGYNCHGLTFASHRTKLDKSSEIKKILDDDNYGEVKLKDVLPGDIVIYYSDSGDPNHSGIVLEYTAQLVVPIICSKWGNAGEFVHGLRDCPSVYGPQCRFFRCRR